MSLFLFFSSRRRHTRCALVTGVQTCALPILRFDWTLLRGAAPSLLWGLSGGLDVDNVAEAVRITGAPLVDISSGVESAPGIKSVDKIMAFCNAASAC